MTKSRKKRKSNKSKRTSLVMFAGFVVVIAVFVVGISNAAITASQKEADEAKAKAALKVYEPFTKCYYHEKDNLKRYKKYQEEHPKLSAGDVVWRINVNLDYKPYDKMHVEKADVSDGNFILVNKQFKLSSHYKPKDLVKFQNGFYIKKDVKKAYDKMQKAAEKEGHYLYVQSGYRSYQTQKLLYQEYRAESTVKEVDKFCARPGYSEHQTGLAIDVNDADYGNLGKFEDTDTYQWLKKNAHKYGFIFRYTKTNKRVTGYQPESWHIRYLGKKHATIIYEKGINSFEEYKVKYIDHKKK